MKGIIFILFFIPAINVLKGQNSNFNWARRIGGIEDDLGSAITVDADGNIYSTGSFEATADFDPGPGIYNLTSYSANSLFISKLDAAGNFIWAKQMGGNGALDGAMGVSITTDFSGNIYCTGYFSGKVDFDPGPGIHNLYTNPNQFVDFIVKLDAAGNFKWAISIGGGSDIYVGANSIVADHDGNVYSSGVFQYKQDFNPGPDTLYLDGTFFGDVYVCKFDSSGNLIWARAPTLNGTSAVDRAFITINDSGDIYCTGSFWGKVDFDPGKDAFMLNSLCDSWDIYIWKLTNDGNFIWVKQMGGPGFETGFTIELDSFDNIVTTGWIENNTADFNPDSGIYNLTASGIRKYESKLDKAGNFISAKLDGSTYPFNEYSIIDANGNRYTIGSFENTMDFDPGPGVVNLSSAGERDIFIKKMGKCNVNTSSILYINECKGYQLNGYTYSNTGVYTQIIPNVTGCDSIITLNLNINRINTDLYVTSCSSYTWHCHTFRNCNQDTTKCITYTASGTYADTVLTPNSCDSIITLHLILGNSSHTNITQTICEGQSFLGHSVSGIFVDTFNLAGGCDSIRRLDLTVSSEPAPDFDSEKELCKGDSLILYPGKFDTYLWQDGTNASNLTVKKQGLYSVEVSNVCGKARSEIQINESICDIYFPTAFTPNHDGKNDIFRILGTFHLSDFHLVIFNRLGQLVFESRDYTKGWAGTINGNEQDTGIYVWFCNFRKDGSKKNTEMKGTVLLLR